MPEPKKSMIEDKEKMISRKFEKEKKERAGKQRDRKKSDYKHQ